MSERELLVVVQPCILCEADMGVMTIWRDDETGEERIEAEWVEHSCPEMSRMLVERRRLASPRDVQVIPLV